MTLRQTLNGLLWVFGSILAGKAIEDEMYMLAFFTALVSTKFAFNMFVPYFVKGEE